ncbi:MAG: hypothetical protein WBF79_14865 [Rhodococcus sp. (in: high G+C Gram-positive bacteria)]
MSNALARVSPVQSSLGTASDERAWHVSGGFEKGIASPLESVLRSIELLGREVAPLVREAMAADSSGEIVHS